MSRPKSSKPLKQKLTLSISEENKLKLLAISSHKGKSISELLEIYAEKEYKKIHGKNTITDFFDEQIKLEN